jgi:hypothetical protein
MKLLLLLAVLSHGIDDRARGFSGGALSDGVSIGGACATYPTGLVCCVDNQGHYCGWALTDVASPEVYFYGYSGGVLSTGVNQAGGDTTLAGGLGIRTFVMTNATCAAPDKITVTVDGAASDCVEGTDFDCDTLTDAQCATNAVVCVAAISGVDACAGTACLASDGFTGVTSTVYVWRTTGGTAVLSDTGGCATVTNGTDGVVAIAGDLTVNKIILDATEDSDTHILGAATDRINFTSAGTLWAQFTAGGSFSSPTNGRPGILFGATATATIPNVLPDRGDPNSGLCQSVDDSVGLCAGGVNMINAVEDTADTVTITADSIASVWAGENGFASACGANKKILTFAADPGDVSKTTSGLIPVGATSIAIASRVLVLGTNCTSADYGDGSDVDLYGDDIALTVGTEVDPSDYTANINYNAIVAEEVTITGVGGNCFDLSVRVVAHYCIWTAPTG